MSRIRVAFAINDAYTEHLNIALYSLLKNNPDHQLDVYILCKSLTKRNQRSIRRTADIYKNTNIVIVELKDRSKRFDGLRLNIQYISIETYYRYLLAEIFPDLEKVLYLDADILVVGDIEEIYSMDLKDFYVAGVNDSYVTTIGKEGTENPSQPGGYKESIGFKRDELYLNAGVLLMNLKKMREDDITARLFDNTVKLFDRIKFQDQDVLNITLQGSTKAVSNIFNYTDQDKRDDVKEASDLRIIHYTGATKPWKNAVFADFQIPFVKLYREYVDEYNKLVYGSTNKFALYTFSTENIGDDIQSVAARRFLPRIDYRIKRDLVGEWRNTDQKEHVKLIANGWYMHVPYKWPIEDKTIDPLYISMYVEQTSPAVVNQFLSNRSRNNFEVAGKVGARDKVTLDFFKKNDIEAYMSGCVTLTLQKDKNIKKQGFILLTDVSQEIYEFVRSSTDREVIYLTNAINTSLERQEELAEIYLYLYQSAHCVITERLHSALPCLALETPVLLIKKEDPSGGNKNRLAGLGELTHYYTESDFLKGKVFDLERPPRNSSDYLKYRKKLIKTCAAFTGFNNEDSFAWTDIGEKTLGDVLAKLEFIKATNLKHATVESMQASRKNEDLVIALEQKNAEIECQNVEIARLMGIKAATRRLVGNIKRRVAREMKNER